MTGNSGQQGSGAELRPIIAFSRLVKTFGAFTALRGVSLEFYPGEVHALLGDNGAGKSTLIKILSGIYAPDSGTIMMDSKSVSFRSPRDAYAVGIGTVYQDLALVPLMTVSRNFFMGRELMKRPRLLGFLNDRRMDEITLRELARIGIELEDPRQPVGTLSGGQQQTLAIARAIYFGARLLILDEPTSALGQRQQMEVLKTILRVRARGDIAIVLITHNELHARLVADRYSFLSLGKLIRTGSKEEVGREDIRSLMAGGAKLTDLSSELETVRKQLGNNS